MKRLLVVGADGFIGRVLCGYALSEGVEVVAADNGRPDSPEPGSMHSGTSGPARRVDVTDRENVRSLIAETQPDALVTLAAHGSGTRGLLAGADSDPVQAVDVNVRGASILLQEAAAASCQHVVLASSTTVYGPTAWYDSEPVSEWVPLLPATVYGGTKAAAEHVAYPLAARLGIRVAAIRLPLVYGGERWYGGSQAALVAFVRALADGRPATVRAWKRPADWMHVHDAAQSLLAAATSTTASGPYNVVGHTSSMADLANALATYATATVDVQDDVDGGPDLPLVNDERARRDLPLTVRHDSPASGARAYLEEVRRQQ